jgi:uncharacterized surface anchored protein
MSPKLLLLTVFAVAASIFANANNGLGTGEENARKVDLLGGVQSTDSKKPLGSVVVTAMHLKTKKEKVVVTDANGQYTFDDLQAGTYKFIFTKNGYRKVIKEKVVIRQDEGFHMDVQMNEHSSFEFMPGPFHLSEFE